MYDAIIVGGGPAGLNAALVLGRCRRKVVVFDAGKPRNTASHGLRGFLSRDGILPHTLLEIGREELTRYGIAVRPAVVMEAAREEGHFSVTLADGAREHGRKLLVATGVVDQLPPVPGIELFYGKSVHHCPYCDGWEHRDGAVAVYGRSRGGAGLAISLKTWSPDVVLFTNGPARLLRAERERLERQGIPIHEEPIERLEGSGERLERIVLRGAGAVLRTAMFFSLPQRQRSALAIQLGCSFTQKGAIKTDRRQCTGVRGLYVAGDAAQEAQFVIVAASQGAKAAIAINKELEEEDRE
jgi:thioredoxin reductase